MGAGLQFVDKARMAGGLLARERAMVLKDQSRCGTDRAVQPVFAGLSFQHGREKSDVQILGAGFRRAEQSDHIVHGCNQRDEGGRDLDLVR